MAGPDIPLRCPYCGAPESDRFVLEGRRFVVFPCQFTAEADASLDEPGLADYVRTAYAPTAPNPFRGTCDRLHLYVTKGAGAAALGAPPD
jgi:hypothetical protein